MQEIQIIQILIVKLNLLVNYYMISNKIILKVLKKNNK